LEELPKKWKGSIFVSVYKNCDEIDSSNYWGISLLLAIYKTSSNILLWRLTPHREEINGDYQHQGFWSNRSTADHICCIHQILEEKWVHNVAVHQLYLLQESLLKIQLWGWSGIIFSLHLIPYETN
jgi:hypothetical protein